MDTKEPAGMPPPQPGPETPPTESQKKVSSPRRRYIGVIGAIFLVMFGIIAAHFARERVRIGYLSIAAHLPLFVSLANHHFEQNGVEVEPVLFPDSVAMLNAIVAGDLEIGYELSADLVLKQYHETPALFRVYQLGVSTGKEPNDSLLVAKDSPIHHVSDLRGKVVGTFPGATAPMMTRLILEKFGLSVPGDVKLKENLVAPMQLGALQQGQVDAVFTYEPIPTIGVRKGLVRELIAGPVEAHLKIDPWIGGMGVMTVRFLERSPEKASAVRDAIYRAFDSISGSKDQSRQRAVLTEFVPSLRQEDYTTLNAIRLTQHWKLSEIDMVALNGLVQIYQSAGVLHSKNVPSVAGLLAKPADFRARAR